MTFNVLRGRKRTPVLSAYVGQDDFGNALFVCPWTQTVVSLGAGYRISGNIVPQANACYVAAPGTERHEQAARQAFYALEANCNMCRHFNRLPYDKKSFTVSGVFYGWCSTGQRAGTFPVAPDDWMGMSCWEPRRSNESQDC